jgi:hypothetical protein
MELKQVSHKIPGNILTTAMAMMPHTDVSRALDMAPVASSEHT